MGMRADRSGHDILPTCIYDFFIRILILLYLTILDTNNGIIFNNERPILNNRIRRFTGDYFCVCDDDDLFCLYLQNIVA
jgi:hypothetical protein